MQNVKENEPYVFSCSGEDLAKVLLFYGLIPDVSQNEYKIVCPFHNDMNPSMIVNLLEGTFFCFGCGASGNAYRFVELMNDKLNSLQVVIKLFEILKSDKVEKIDFSNRRKIKKQTKESYYIAHDYYYGLSKVDWINDEQQEVIDARNYMKERGFIPSTFNKCGAKVTYNNQYGIIFPMLDEGHFKGWVCRTMRKDIEAKRKYLYNEGFSRATTLVGNYENYDYIFVVEGYMDRLKYIQYGVDNVVAILGWKMSKEQEDKLKQSNVKWIISSLDNDECGKKGTEYLKKIFNGKVTRFCYLKGTKDPGEMTKQMFSRMYKKTLEKMAQDRRKL